MKNKEKKVIGTEDGIELTDEQLLQVTGGKENSSNNQENNYKLTITAEIEGQSK